MRKGDEMGDYNFKTNIDLKIEIFVKKNLFFFL